MDEAELKKTYADAGVDLPELKEEPKVEEPKVIPPEEPKEPAKEPEEKKEVDPLQEPKEHRKRSIYDEYKDKKSELKSERELREQAERERDELKTKLEAVNSAKTPEERKDAADDLEAFAKEIDANPEALRKMRDLFLKDVKPDERLSKDLEEFKAWKAQNSQAFEQQMFDKEFTQITPSLKEMFPTISDEELQTVKKEIDKLSHTKEWHDKDLDYVVYKNKETLKAFVSPKKRGIEGKSRRDAEGTEFDFDPNANYADMTPAQREQWEAEYRKMSANTALASDGKGGKLLL